MRSVSIHISVNIVRDRLSPSRSSFKFDVLNVDSTVVKVRQVREEVVDKSGEINKVVNKVSRKV